MTTEERRKVDILEVHAPMLTATTRYVVNVGARGTGKSYAACGQVAPLLMMQDKSRGVLARKVKDTCRNSVWAEFKAGLQRLGLYNDFKLNNTLMQAEAPNGSVLSCIGFDDPEKIKSLQGVKWAIIEEADSCTWTDIETLDFSMRQGNDKLIFLANPPATVPGVRHWLQSRFIDVDRPDTTKIKAFYWDNEFLPPAYVKQLQDLEHTNPTLYKRWVLGEFTTLEGAIFQNWSTVAGVPDGAEFLGYGLDFGFANDPAAFIAVYRWNGGFLFDELIYQTGLTNSDLIRRFQELEIDTRAEIVADSAEPKSIEEINRSGYFITPAKKGPDSIRNGIDYMQSFPLHVTERSKNLLTEFSSYTWKTDKQGNIKPQPIDSFNHGIDSIRYFLQKYQLDRPRTKTLTFSF